MQSLFVYGTLRLGQPNAHVMEQIGGVWRKGYIRGHLESKGWGAALGSPGIHLSEQGDPVEGYVFMSENLAQHWDVMDHFEGDEYCRVAVQVYLEDDSTMLSQVYALKNSK